LRPGRGWRAILAGAGSHAVLARLLQGDPLELRSRVARALERRALVLDAERAFLRALARTARLAQRYRGEPALGTWLDQRVDEALLELVREDQEAERSEAAPAVSASLCRPLGLEPRAARRILTALNSRPLAERRAFCELVVAGRAFDGLGPQAVPTARLARRRGLRGRRRVPARRAGPGSG
jgi:hypothetical protein